MDMTKVLSISIHALLTESDWLLGTEFQTLPLISIHALLTESDAPLAHHPRDSQISIHALLTESDGEPAGGGGHHGISIHALLAESDFGGVRTYLDNIISIHALLAESDVIRNFPPRAARGFQSTLSLRRATATGAPHTLTAQISIHALLAESDYCAPPPERIQSSFQSTLSLRRATAVSMSWDPRDRFQSTLSLRRATVVREHLRALVAISIHALLAESDEQGYSLKEKEQYFNPRSPCGERLRSGVSEVNPRYFNPRSPCGERLPGLLHQFLSVNFNPRSPCGERPCSLYFLDHATRFQSTLSLRRATWPPSDTALTPWDFNPRSPCGERLQLIQTEGQMIEISIHALLAESDPRARLRIPPQPIFQSTLSLRRATATHPNRGADD